MAVGGGTEGPGLETGTEFAGHRIVGVLGKGGMGVVYRARKLSLDRDRALKVIAPALSDDPRFRERFKRESRMAARIEHPNVIPVHDAGEEGGMLYLAMRLVEGSDLHRVAARSGVSAERAARIVAGVAAALDAAHAAGLVHRDVKPANVLIEEREGAEHVFLTDFGITRTTSGGETLTGTGEFVGSVEYIAPEQAAGEPVDARTDVYSLGGVAHFALTGDPPFPRETPMATLFAHANAPRPRPTAMDPDLPEAVDAVIVKAMATDPADRYPSAGELAADLDRALGMAPGVVTAAAPTAGPETAPAATVAAPGEDRTEAAQTRRLPRERGRRRGLLPAALLAIAAAAVAVIVVIATGGGETETGGGGDGGGRDGGAPADAPRPEEESTIDVQDAPNGLTIGEEAKAWVAEPRAGLVEGIDTETDQVVPPSAEAPDASSVAVGFGSIWAVSRRENSVYRLDPAQGTDPIAIPVGQHPSDIAIDENGLWVTNEGDGTVNRIDPATDQVDVTEQLGTGSGPRSVATGGGAIWVANIEGRTVMELDPDTGTRTGRPMPMGNRPNDVAYGEDGVWVIDNIDGTLTRIDPQSQEVGDPIEVGTQPRGVKVGFGFVWVANGGDATVSAVDPEALEEVANAKVGRDPADIAIGEGSVWTANQGDSTVTRLDPGID